MIYNKIEKKIICSSILLILVTTSMIFSVSSEESYKIQNSGDITSTDVSIVWANRT